MAVIVMAMMIEPSGADITLHRPFRYGDEATRIDESSFKDGVAVFVRKRRAFVTRHPRILIDAATAIVFWNCSTALFQPVMLSRQTEQMNSV
jgi:hypothetical protein